MRIESELNDYNGRHVKRHEKQVSLAKQLLELEDSEWNKLVDAIASFQVAVPSWALGTGGTRFGRFPAGGEPRNLEEKIEDVGLLHALSKATDSISLHIPWDIPDDVASVKAQLAENHLSIDAVNSNTFQDQKGQDFSYKFGSLCHTDAGVREEAIEHNIEVIRHGEALGSTMLSVWLADGSNFPGQHNFRQAYERTLQSLMKIYAAMPDNWSMLLEYKPYEPNFYSMVLPDWGTSLKMCEACGERADVLVDLGHHLPNTNIEQIVARLTHFGRLGGFHFNGSQYGDDDLTTGSIKPFQLYLIFVELVMAKKDKSVKNPAVAYMIDASHNTKDPLVDLLMSLEQIRIAYAKALLTDFNALHRAQEENDVAGAELILQRAFQSDVRPLLADARLKSGGCVDPIAFFNEARVRENLVSQRGKLSVATGL